MAQRQRGARGAAGKAPRGGGRPRGADRAQDARSSKAAPGTDDLSASGSRIERVLAYMFATMVGLSILCFVVIIIATFAGMNSASFAEGLWPIVAVVPLVGLPLGFVVMISLIVLSLRRRSREAAASAPPRAR